MKIAHFSDVHIRNFKYHDTYRFVFDKVYNELNIIKPDYIVIVGDLFESFVDISNEADILASEFLNSLSEISKVIITHGNHDCMIKNKSRINSVKKLCSIINNPDIIYLEKTGIYDINDIVWVNYSYLEKGVDPYHNYKRTNKLHIGLFHDPIYQSKTSANKEFDNSYLPITYFDNNDFLLLGDIHKFQYFRDNKSAAYPSSTIQQNFGETPNEHGFILWDIIDKDNFTSKYYDIENPYNMVNVCLNNIPDYDNINIENEYINKHSAIKVNWIDNVSNINYKNEIKILNFFKDKYQIDNVIFDKDIIFNDITDVEILNESLDVNDENTQRDIFIEYLKSNKYSDDIIQSILVIDNKINNRINYIPKNNVNWSIEKIWFDNFKSYGDDNIIEWKYKNGIFQINGKNQNGKTTLLDVITYILYNNTTTTLDKEKFGDNRYININRDLDYCSAGMELNINNEIYILNRKTERFWNKDNTKITKCPTSITITKGDEILNEQQSKDTNEYIINTIGSFDDFIRLSLTTADNLNSLLSLDRAIFIDTLSKDIGFSIFDTKLKETKSFKEDELKDNINIDVKSHQSIIESNNELLIKYDNNIKNIDVKISNILHDKQVKINEIDKYRSTIINIPENILNIDIEQLQNDNIQKQQTIDINNNKLITINSYKDIVNKYNITILNNKENEYRCIENDINALILQKSSKENDILKVQNLKDVEINRVKTLLNEEKQELNNRLNNLREVFADKINSEKERLTTIINSTNIDINNINNTISNNDKDITNLVSKNAELEHNKICITCNRKLDDKDIEYLGKQILINIDKIKVLQDSNIELNKSLSSITQNLLKYNTELTDFKDKKYSGDILNLFNISKTESEVIKTRISEIDNHKYDTVKYDNKIEELNNDIIKIDNDIITKKDVLLNINNELLTLKAEKTNIDNLNNIISTEDKIILNNHILSTEIKENNKLIDERTKSFDDIKFNNTINDKIEIINNEIKNIDELLNIENNNRIDILTNIKVLENDIIVKNIEIDKYIKQKEYEELIKLYVSCVHRDGIPSFLLKKSIHIINQELNNLLMNVDFVIYFDEELKLKLSNKKNITKSINVQTASGKERTFSAVVLKMALRKINNNSKPNFLIFDEITGKLDNESVETFMELLYTIKDDVQKLIIIEHQNFINYDYIINVTKDNNNISSLTIE